MVEEKLKKSLKNTLDKNSPFDWKYLLSNKWRKPLERVGKTVVKIHLKSWRKQPPNAPIYRARKTSRWEPDWPVGRPPGRPANGQISDR